MYDCVNTKEYLILSKFVRNTKYENSNFNACF